MKLNVLVQIQRDLLLPLFLDAESASYVATLEHFLDMTERTAYTETAAIMQSSWKKLCM